MRLLTLLRACVLLGLLLAQANAVDRSKFKTCSQSGFCRRHRSKSVEQTLKIEGTPVLSGHTLTASVLGSSTPLDLTVDTLASGAIRAQLTEKGMPPRWQSPDILLESTFQYATPILVDGNSAVVSSALGAPVAGANTLLSFTSNLGNGILLVIRHQPWSLELYVDGVLQLSANQRSLAYVEARQGKTSGDAGAGGVSGGAGGDEAHGGRKILDWGEDGKAIYADGEEGGEEGATGGEAATEAAGARTLQGQDQDGLWEENFGSHRDSKPNGPTSVGVDITFHGSSNVFGIPEHATSLSLKSTDGSPGAYSEPYRLYNLDVFEYELDQTMSLYGSIPFMMGHGIVPTKASSSSPITSGVFWNNPSETYIDVSKEGFGPKAVAKTRWISESGAFDLFLLPGPTFAAVSRQYTLLTGTQAIPPKFALAYHQCRWNYKDETDVLSVDAKFEENNFPYDVLWLDIEHTDGKRYFTWDQHLFPNPVEMQEKLSARGRRMVTIVDPHIKRDNGYSVHQTGSSKGYYIKDRSGNDFEGWCWPGSSSYLDFTSPEVRSWWSDQFLVSNYKGSTDRLYTWNDMNEPSVFNGPEVSMDKDAKSIAGVEHREWHNLYGFYQQYASGEGQKRRAVDGNTRPFVLSRAFFAGSQRFGAIWTGDNMAAWDHLQASAPMLLSISLAGLSFAGADVGGFFKNPDAELMTRWYQAGAFQPFFRAHSHIETQRREPWLFGQETTDNLRDIVRLRYSFLPYWYTLFYTAYTTGLPPMRPLWAEFPTDASLFDVQDQWMVGSALIVKPVTSAGTVSSSVLLPGTPSTRWYDIITYEAFTSGRATIRTPLNKIPVFQRGGTIVPRQMRPRRSSDLMANDPYTLVIACDDKQTATGTLFVDDGITYDFERKGEFAVVNYTFGGGRVTSVLSGGKSVGSNRVERIVIVGVPTPPTSVTLVDKSGSKASLTATYEPELQKLTIRKPDALVAADWTIQLS